MRRRSRCRRPTKSTVVLIWFDLNVKTNISFVNISSKKMLLGRNSHLMRRCKQPFVRGLDSSRHLFASGIQKLVYGWDKCLNEFRRYIDRLNINFDV